MQASCCLCLTSSTWGWTILEQEVKLENQAALFFPGLYPKGFFQAAMQTGWSLLSCSPGLWSCFFFGLFLSHLCPEIIGVLQKPPALLESCCVAHPADIRVGEALIEDHGLQT